MTGLKGFKKNNKNYVENFTNSNFQCPTKLCGPSEDEEDDLVCSRGEYCSINGECGRTDEYKNGLTEYDGEALEVIYLTPKELEMRKADPSQIYSIENGGDTENNISESPFFVDDLAPSTDISNSSLSERNFYNFIKKYMGTTSEKFIRENDIDTADLPLVGEKLEPKMTEPNWANILSGTGLGYLAGVMSLYWKYAPGFSNEVSDNIKIGDMGARFEVFQKHTGDEKSSIVYII